MAAGGWHHEQVRVDRWEEPTRQRIRRVLEEHKAVYSWRHAAQPRPVTTTATSARPPGGVVLDVRPTGARAKQRANTAVSSKRTVVEWVTSTVKVRDAGTMTRTRLGDAVSFSAGVRAKAIGDADFRSVRSAIASMTSFPWRRGGRQKRHAVHNRQSKALLELEACSTSASAPRAAVPRPFKEGVVSAGSVARREQPGFGGGAARERQHQSHGSGGNTTPSAFAALPPGDGRQPRGDPEPAPPPAPHLSASHSGNQSVVASAPRPHPTSPQPPSSNALPQDFGQVAEESLDNQGFDYHCRGIDIGGGGRPGGGGGWPEYFYPEHCPQPSHDWAVPCPGLPDLQVAFDAMLRAHQILDPAANAANAAAAAAASNSAGPDPRDCCCSYYRSARNAVPGASVGGSAGGSAMVCMTHCPSPSSSGARARPAQPPPNLARPDASCAAGPAAPPDPKVNQAAEEESLLTMPLPSGTEPATRMFMPPIEEQVDEDAVLYCDITTEQTIQRVQGVLSHSSTLSSIDGDLVPLSALPIRAAIRKSASATTARWAEGRGERVRLPTGVRSGPATSLSAVTNSAAGNDGAGFAVRGDAETVSKPHAVGEGMQRPDELVSHGPCGELFAPGITDAVDDGVVSSERCRRRPQQRSAPQTLLGRMKGGASPTRVGRDRPKTARPESSGGVSGRGRLQRARRWAARVAFIAVLLIPPLLALAAVLVPHVCDERMLSDQEADSAPIPYHISYSLVYPA